MKHYHPIGERFKLTQGGKEYILVARECETETDKLGNTYRKTCTGCFFARLKNAGWCSGHPYFENECQVTDHQPKCSPDQREDGKYIHYKRIVPTQK